MLILTWVLVTLAVAANGQNDGNNTNNDDNGVDSGNNSGHIVATSVVVSLVLMIVVALTITMWVCACCRPEKAFNKRFRQTNKRWHWKSTIRRAVSSDIDRLPMLGSVEANDKRKSLDINIDLRDSKMWRSNENILMDGSCDDLSASQNYVHTMNYSENENDFQTLKLDETLFENPSSRSRSEAQLSSVVFSNTTGLQAKVKKLDDLSNEKVLEFYDLHTPKSSPRKNRASYSTGDLACGSLSAGNLRSISKQTESPLVNQQEETLTVTIEQSDSAVKNVERIDNTVDSEQVVTTGDEITDQIGSVPMASTETPSLQEDIVSTTSKDSLRETLTGTPDSGVVVNDQDNQGNNQSDNTSDGVEIGSKSDTSSDNSPAHHPVTTHVNTAGFVVNEEQSAVLLSPVVNDTASWETVADRKKRYLQTIEHSKVQRKTSTDFQTGNMASSSFTQVEADSDYGNSDEEPTTVLSSSQPVLNLTSLEDPKLSLRDDDDSSSDSDLEEMQSPLVSTKLSPRDNSTQTGYANPLLSDSSDEDCEMVKPGEVVAYRPSVKGSGQDATQHRASHPPLQRSLNHEQPSTGVVQHSKKRRHKPSLKSILEEDSDSTHHTNTL